MHPEAGPESSHNEKKEPGRKRQQKGRRSNIDVDHDGFSHTSASSLTAQPRTAPSHPLLIYSTAEISHQSTALLHLSWLSALGCALKGEWLEPRGRVSPAEAASSTGRGAVVTHGDPCRVGTSLGSRFAWAVGRGYLTESPCAKPWEYPRVLLDVLADVVSTPLKMTPAASSTPTKLGY
ncbi:hypothetical protein DFH06DRAFT_1196689 [Mycena polygramma]|nr:hypothetical protein DFH06DRAFT_1196689 [Mycena polygramma]